MPGGTRRKGAAADSVAAEQDTDSAKVAKAEARANAKLVVEPLEHKLARDVLN